MDFATFLLVFGVLGLLLCFATMTGAFIDFGKRIADTAEKYVADAASFEKAVLVQDDSRGRGSKSDPLLVSVSAGDCEVCECGSCYADDDDDEDSYDGYLSEDDLCGSSFHTCYCNATGNDDCKAWCDEWSAMDSATGREFFRLRCTAGMPYEEVAVLAGLGADWGAKLLKEFEDGEITLPLPVLRDVLRVMGATLDDLMAAAEPTGEGGDKESEGKGDE